MRFGMAFAACLLWAGVAAAQNTTPPTSAPTDSTAAQTQTSSTTSAPADQATPAPTTPPADPIICHTTQSTGSRLAARGHVTRICKTRTQWEMEQDDLRHQVGRMTEQAYQQEPGARGSGNN